LPQNQQDTGSAEQVNGFFGITVEEFDHQQVEEYLKGTL